MTEVSRVEHLPPMSTAVTTNRSVIMYRLGGRQYPMKTVATCKVCQSPHRLEIERSLIRSYAPTTIWRSLPESVQEHLSVRNITDHANKHLPVDHAIRHAALEARTRELGRDIESAEGALVDHILFARTGMQQVYERMVEGDIKPDVKDGIAFATLLLKVTEQAGDGLDEEMYARGFMAYMSAMRQVCTPEQIQQIGRLLNQDPVLQSLLAASERHNRQEIEATAVVQEG